MSTLVFRELCIHNVHFSNNYIPLNYFYLWVKHVFSKKSCFLKTMPHISGSHNASKSKVFSVIFSLFFFTQLVENIIKVIKSYICICVAQNIFSGSYLNKLFLYVFYQLCNTLYTKKGVSNNYNNICSI